MRANPLMARRSLLRTPVVAGRRRDSLFIRKWLTLNSMASKTKLM
jgi:hypothetical protein